MLAVMTLILIYFNIFTKQEGIEMKNAGSIDTIIIFTENLEALAKFYQEGFGLGPYEEAPGHMGLRLGSIYFGLDHVQKKEEFGNSITIWFAVNDIKATYDRLLSLGARERYAPNRKPWGDIVGSIFDPDGNVVGLVERNE